MIKIQHDGTLLDVTEDSGTVLSNDQADIDRNPAARRAYEAATRSWFSWPRPKEWYELSADERQWWEARYNGEGAA